MYIQGKYTAHAAQMTRLPKKGPFEITVTIITVRAREEQRSVHISDSYESVQKEVTDILQAGYMHTEATKTKELGHITKQVGQQHRQYILLFL